jgi:hypothetical protein
MAKKAIRNQWTAVHTRDMLQAWRIPALEVVGLRPGDVSHHPPRAILATFFRLRLITP